MVQVNCIRCGALAEGLKSAPFPGQIGQDVLNKICGLCWKDWLAQQVRIINHFGLDVLEPDHQRFLLDQMKQFLNLPGAEDLPPPIPPGFTSF